jgi:hypothetical protein
MSSKVPFRPSSGTRTPPFTARYRKKFTSEEWIRNSAYRLSSASRFPLSRTLVWGVTGKNRRRYPLKKYDEKNGDSCSSTLPPTTP